MDNDHNGSKDPSNGNGFWEFIDNLESLNLLRDPDKEYIEGLIERYGLPEDDTAKEALVEIRKQMCAIEIMMSEPFFSYLSAFLDEIIIGSENRTAAVYVAFICGIIFKEIMEPEEI